MCIQVELVQRMLAISNAATSLKLQKLLRIDHGLSQKLGSRNRHGRLGSDAGHQ